jgi:DNA-binding MarR family transcriptional regulator
MTSEILTDRELTLLEEIEHDPDVTQASLASQLGVAVGTVNWHLKRLVAKGYVKVKRAQRRKLRYIITPEGLAFRAMLTVNYIETSMRLYRKTRQYVRELLTQVRAAGFDQVYIEGEGDIADICRLTCLEMGVGVGEQSAAAPASHIPALEVIGTKVYLRMEEGLERQKSG